MDSFLTLREALRAVARHWLVAGTVSAGTLFIVAFVTFNQTPVYESTAVLLVKLGREFLHSPGVGRDIVLGGRDREAIINAEVEILRSRDLMETVLSSVGQQRVYPEMAAPSGDAQVTPSAVERFRRGFAVEPVIEASVIRVSFRHPEPELTAEVVNRLVDGFKEKHLQAFSDPQTTKFLEEKVATYRRKLEEVEQRIQRFQADNRPYLDGGEALLRRREDLVGSLKAIEGDIAGLRERLAYLNTEKETTSKLPASGGSPPEIVETQANLLKLQLEEQRLLASFKEDNRQVVSVRKQIELVKKFLEEREATLGPGGSSRQLDAEIIETQGQLRFQQARASQLRQQLAEINAELVALPRREAEYRDLTRDRDTIEESYQTYAKNLEDARISEEMNRQKIANITVIQEGVVPTTPISPRKKFNLGIGVLVGAALGMGAAYLLETLV